MYCFLHHTTIYLTTQTNKVVNGWRVRQRKPIFNWLHVACRWEPSLTLSPVPVHLPQELTQTKQFNVPKLFMSRSCRCMFTWLFLFCLIIFLPSYFFVNTLNAIVISRFNVLCNYILHPVALLHRSSKQKQANNTLASERMQGKEFRILPRHSSSKQGKRDRTRGLHQSERQQPDLY